MSPKPFVDQQHTTSQYEPHPDECPCPPCHAYRQQHPAMSWKPIRRVLLFSLPIWICLAVLGLLIVHSAQAREGGIKPIPAPPALLKERAECTTTKNTETCLRSKLRIAYTSLEWARKERAARTRPYGVQHALRLAAALYGIPLSQLRGVGECESNLTPTSRNTSSTAAGLFQFLDTTWNRAGIPGFSVYDPYANAIAAARLVQHDHGWREWSCAWAA